MPNGTFIVENQLILHVVKERLELQALMTTAAYQLFPVGVMSIIQGKGESTALETPDGLPVSAPRFKITSVQVPVAAETPQSFPRAKAESLQPQSIDLLLEAMRNARELEASNVKQHLLKLKEAKGVTIPDKVIIDVASDALKMVKIIRACLRSDSAIVFAPSIENNAACDVVAVLRSGTNEPQVHIYLVEVRDRRQSKPDEVKSKLSILSAHSLIPLVKSLCHDIDIIVHFVYAGRAPITVEPHSQNA